MDGSSSSRSSSVLPTLPYLSPDDTVLHKVHHASATGTYSRVYIFMTLILVSPPSTLRTGID